MNDGGTPRPRICLWKSLCTVLLGVTTIPASVIVRGTPQTTAHIAGDTQFTKWSELIKQTLFVPKKIPLSAVMHGEFAPEPGIRAEKVTYATEFQMRVPAIVYRPAPEHGRLPAIVVVNGHGGDKYSWYSFYTGVLYARAGAVVLTYDPIGEGERNPERKSGTRQHDRVINAPHYAPRLAGLMITDVRQAVSYLRQRPDVDPSRIAVLGYSMGSFVSILAGAIDPRISVIVLSGGGDLDGSGGYWENSGKPMCQAIPWKLLSVLGDKAAVIYALNQRRGPTLIMNGTRDTVVDIPGHHEQPFFDDLATRVKKLTGTEKNIFATYWVNGASHRPSWVTKPAALWLQDKLHFPRWTGERIEEMPETHVSVWAARHDVTIDKGYASEDREGGVVALAADIPAIPRTALNVLTDAEWEQQKDRMVYGVWVRHALAADGITGTAADKAIATAHSTK